MRDEKKKVIQRERERVRRECSWFDVQSTAVGDVQNNGGKRGRERGKGPAG